MTTRKRVGGGYKIIKAKSVSIESLPALSDLPDSSAENSYKRFLGPSRKLRSKAFSTESLLEAVQKEQITGEETIEEKAELESVKEKEDAPEKEDDNKSLHESLKSFLPPDYDKKGDDDSNGKSLYEEYPILRYIQDSVIGHNLVIDGPFGPRKVVYCDFTASGRSLTFVEDYIRNFVCPFYANTHSDTGRNARQTTKFREEAREIIKQCTNASKDDVVIFTGSGATGGIHKVAFGLKVNQPRVAEETVVFTGPYEHHANILPWKEYGCTIVRIRDAKDGCVDQDHLESELKFWKDKRRHMLVSMSACSNVTGIITDTVAVASISHRHGALTLFDYAGGGPYLDINMNPSKKAYKDISIISPHKFIGGPGTPGVVIAKKWIFRNQVPDRVGGGTVSYVSREFHKYLSSIEHREEGGTPAIIESIRTGLVFQLKQSVGTDVIEARDEELCRRAFSVWERNPSLIILGSHTAQRVTIFSFVVKHVETGKFLHCNYVSTLLNDMYGIQSRGGCACAGPYGHDLMGISEPLARRLAWFVSESPGKDSTCPTYPLNVMRPGFCRVNLPYFYDDQTIDYIIHAVDAVATCGWKFLPEYTFDMYSGSWKHKMFSDEEEENYHSLHDLEYNNRGTVNFKRKLPVHTSNMSLQDIQKEAEKLFMSTDGAVKYRKSSASSALADILPKDKRKLRWFLTPGDAISLLVDAEKNPRRRKMYRCPFQPRSHTPREVMDEGLYSLTDRSDNSKDSIESKDRVKESQRKHPWNAR